MKGARLTMQRISYSLCIILWGNDSAQSSTAPQWHNNQEVQTAPINRAARGDGGPGGREIRQQSVNATEPEIEPIYTD